MVLGLLVCQKKIVKVSKKKGRILNEDIRKRAFSNGKKVWLFVWMYAWKCEVECNNRIKVIPHHTVHTIVTIAVTNELLQ